MTKEQKIDLKDITSMDWSDEDVFVWLTDTRKMTLEEDFHRHLAGIIKTIILKKRHYGIDQLKTIMGWCLRLLMIREIKINRWMLIKYVFKA